MPILNVQTSVTGLSGTVPSFIYLNTNDTFATVTTTGYLNSLKQEGYFLSPSQLAVTQTEDEGVTILSVQVSGGNVSLVPINGEGGVTLPTTANHLAVFTNTTGNLSEDALVAINNGNIQAGLNGSAGEFISYPSTANTGYLSLYANPNTGNHETIITNAAMAQNSTIALPDPGVTTSYFLLTDSANGQAITTGGLTINHGHLTLGNNVVNNGGNLTIYSGSANYGAVSIVCSGDVSNSTTTYELNPCNQNTYITVPEPGNSFAQFLLAPGVAPFTSGNLPVASGTNGLMIDSGVSAAAIRLPIYGTQTNNGTEGAIINYTIVALESLVNTSLIFVTVTSVTTAGVYPITIKPGTTWNGSAYVAAQGELCITWSAGPGVHSFDYQAIIAP